MNPLKSLQDYGQSLWLDYIRRDLITTGELKRLVEEDGLSGMTSNPTIFQQAIGGSTDYDDALHTILKANPQASLQDVYERLAIEDIQMVADILRPVYQATDGADGFISLEASPHLAYDTSATIAEVRRLWQAVNRPNLMVKVPATPQGIPAIESLIAEGININVTLMFSLNHYEAVAQAYIRGLERNPNPRRLASVASFFVSRIDTAVDRALNSMGTTEALALRGKAAIASCKRVYRRFREVSYGEPFAAQQRQGARIQRVLWGSTSTKNPAYSDVMYVEELIGPDTVNTMPPVTLNAFRDHGRVQLTLLEGTEEAESFLARLAELGVDLDTITEQLQKDGVTAFADSFDQLLATLEKKRQSLSSAI